MVPVKSFMVPAENFVTVDLDVTARHAAELMCDKEIGCILVTRADNIIGILTETDLVRRVVAKGMDASTTSVELIMCAPIMMIDENKTLLDANDLMAREHVRHLGVSQNGKLVGMVSVRDLVMFLTNIPKK